MFSSVKIGIILPFDHFNDSSLLKKIGTNTFRVTEGPMSELNTLTSFFIVSG